MVFKISHSFFDKLFIFAEAVIEQAHYVMHFLDLFYQASRQQSKNKKFILPRTL